MEEFTREGGPLNFYDFTGMRLNIEKCSIWTLRTAFPTGDFPIHVEYYLDGSPAEAAEQQRVMAAEERARLRAIFPATCHAMRGLREPAQEEPERSKDAHLSQGVKLLGSPVVGTDEFVNAELSETIAKAREYVLTAQRILLGDSEHHHAAEYLALMRVTLPGRFTHHCGAVGSGLLAGKAAEFDELQRWAYESVVGQLDGTHIDAVTLLHSPTLWGGRGHVSARRVCDALLVGAWAMTHASNRSRLGPIRRAPVLSDTARRADCTLDVTTDELRRDRPELVEWCEGLDMILVGRHDGLGDLFNLTLRASTLNAYERLNGAWRVVQEELLPRVIETNRETLRHLRNVLPEEVQPLSVYGENIGRGLARPLSMLLHGEAFLEMYDRSESTARAVILEMATANATDWVRARPFDDSERAPRHARLPDSRAVTVAHQTFLLQTPAVHPGCQGCGAVDAWRNNPIHLAACPCGIRASDTLHHPIRDLLAEMLREAYGSHNVRVEPSDYATLCSVLKRPDIVVLHAGIRSRGGQPEPNAAGGPGIHLIIDVKTLDSSAPTHIATNHTDRFALGALTEAQASLPSEYTDSGRAPDAIGVHELTCAAVGRYGGIGSELSRLIVRCARRRGNRTGLEDVNAETSTFIAVWRHRISLTIAAATTNRVLRNAVAPEYAQTAMLARRAAAEELQRRYRRRAQQGRQQPQPPPPPPQQPPPTPPTPQTRPSGDACPRCTHRGCFQLEEVRDIDGNEVCDPRRICQRAECRYDPQYDLLHCDLCGSNGNHQTEEHETFLRMRTEEEDSSAFIERAGAEDIRADPEDVGDNDSDRTVPEEWDLDELDAASDATGAADAGGEVADLAGDASGVEANEGEAETQLDTENDSNDGDILGDILSGEDENYPESLPDSENQAGMTEPPAGPGGPGGSSAGAITRPPSGHSGTSAGLSLPVHQAPPRDGE